jgi:hypothetical protein
VVPANLPGFSWQPTRPHNPLSDIFVIVGADGGAPELQLTVSADAGPPVALRLEPETNATLRLIPSTALRPGLTYTFHDAGACDRFGSIPDTFTFTTTEAAPLPTALGELSVTAVTTAPLELAGGAGCSEQIISARAEVSLTLSASAKPWKDAFVYSTWVDGQPWTAETELLVFNPHGESWVGRGRDLVYSACEETDEASPGLSQGPHSIELRAALPGTELELRSDPVMVALRCSEPPPSHPTPSDAGAPPGTDKPDTAGSVPDPRNETAEREIRPQSGDCSCRNVAPRPGSSVVLLLAVVSFTGLMRSRKRAKLAAQRASACRKCHVAAHCVCTQPTSTTCRDRVSSTRIRIV